MERIALGTINLSRIAYGMWRLTDDADRSVAHTRAKVDACLEQGITTIDQADIYGGYISEAVFGAALRADPALRARIEIISKCGIVAPAGRHATTPVKHYDTSRAHIMASVEYSLSDMATDYIDLLLIHRPDPFIDPEETGRALDDLVAAGKVRAVGVSNFKRWDFALLQGAMHGKLVTNQIELSLGAHEAFTDGAIADLQQRRLHPMAWSPLAGGSLSAGAARAMLDTIAARHGVDWSSIAVAWLLTHPSGIIPVMGTNRVERIARLSEAMDVRLTRTEWYELYTAALGREVA